MMDQRFQEYASLCNDMKVHKRTASNVRDQLVIAARYAADGDLNIDAILEASISSACRSLRAQIYAPVLQNYLCQGEIAKAVNDLQEAIWGAVQVTNDEVLQEEIESQREIYEADRKADAVILRRLLRDNLRKSSIQQLVKDLGYDSMRLLADAVKLEIASSSSSSDVQTLYHTFLEQVERLSQSSLSPGGLPVSDLTGKIYNLSEKPVTAGALCLMYSAELYGKRVCVYMCHRSRSIQSTELPLNKDSLAWMRLEHPNILPILGTLRNWDNTGVDLVAPWMENGVATDYVNLHENADILQLLIDVATGLAYLHSRDPPFVHGMVNSSAILVNDEGSALLGGFASMAYATANGLGMGSPVRYMAPEQLNGAPNTREGDVYGFAMSALKIISGEPPYVNIRLPLNIINKATSGQHPARPVNPRANSVLDDALWALLKRCWAHDPTARPSAADVLRELCLMRDARTRSLRTSTMGSGGDGEAALADVRDLTGEVALEDGVFAVFASGGFGEIRRGRTKEGVEVALKSLVCRAPMQPVWRLTKRFRREVSIWNALKHPNVLPFLGVADLPGMATCFVSPWMQNGNCVEYLNRNATVPCLSIIKDIARGLAYLHNNNPPVVHGDLRGANVLISDAGEAVLCDFGLAVIIEDLTKMPLSSSLKESGNPRWMAPELLIGENLVSQEADVWALGMVIYEVLTLQMPFWDIKLYPQVILFIHNGGRPSTPGEEALERGFTDKLWELMQRCWMQEPTLRPTAGDVLRALENSSRS